MLLVAYRNTSVDIVIAADAPAPVRFAAEELQRYIERIINGGLPIRVDTPAPGSAALGAPNGRGAIFVGPSAAAGARFPDALARLDAAGSAALPSEAYLIQTREPFMLVLGGSPRGTLYGVYDLLERLGVRWWTPDAETIPLLFKLAAPDLNFEYRPPLLYRAMGCGYTPSGDWQARMRLDAGALCDTRLQDRHGGMEIFAAGAWGHTAQALVPPEKYFDAHPEYYSQVNGKRLRYTSQLCCTNPAVADIAAETARQWLRLTPQSRLVSITQNDWGNWCTCPDCAAIIARTGAPSGPNLHLANEVAKRLEHDFPGVLIDTFAYGYTEVAPRHMTAHPNVLVRIAPIDNCFGHTIRTCPLNQRCRDSVKNWAQIARQIFVWHYMTDFAHYFAPFPNLPSFADDLHFYLEHGLKGLFLQGGGRGQDLCELKGYMMAKLAWDPAQDWAKLRREFMAGYYREAAGAIDDYVSTFEKSFAKAKGKCHLPVYRSMWDNDVPYLKPDVLSRAEKVLEGARHDARHDQAVLERIDPLQAGLDYAQLFYHQRPGRRRLEGRTMRCPVSATRARRVERFLGISRHNRVTNYGDEMGRYTSIGSLERAWQASIGEHPVVRLRAGGAEAVVVPALGGRIVDYRLIKGPAAALGNLLGESAPSTLGYPCAGGYEEYTRRPHQSPGFAEAFKVVRRSPGDVVLRAELETGLALHRHISLDRRTGEVVVSTQLQNPSGFALPGCMRAHLEIDLHTSPAEMEVWLHRGAAWERQEGVRRGTWYDEEVGDAWVFWSTRWEGGILQRWAGGQVAALFLGTMPGEPTAIALDLANWRYEREIPAGGCQAMDHCFGWTTQRPG